MFAGAPIIYSFNKACLRSLPSRQISTPLSQIRWRPWSRRRFHFLGVFCVTFTLFLRESLLRCHFWVHLIVISFYWLIISIVMLITSFICFFPFSPQPPYFIIRAFWITTHFYFLCWTSTFNHPWWALVRRNASDSVLLFQNLTNQM
jgi:hypothetical protein